MSLAEELRDLTGETVHTATPYGDPMLTVGRIDSSNAHRPSYDLGSQDQLHVSAVGKAYLASLSESAFEALLPQLDLQAETPFSITSEIDLRSEIEKTRERGYSLNLEETTVGVCSLGFAVRLRSNLEMVALSITGPAHRWTPEAIGEIAPDLLKRVTARSPLTQVGPS